MCAKSTWLPSKTSIFIIFVRKEMRQLKKGFDA